MIALTPALDAGTALGASTHAEAFIKAGKLRPIAVSSRQRVRAFANVPTIAETVVPNYEVTAWFGVD